MLRGRQPHSQLRLTSCLPLSRCIKTVAVSAGLQLVTVPGGPGPNGYILTRCLLVRRREDGVTAYAVELGTPQHIHTLLLASRPRGARMGMRMACGVTCRVMYCR